MSVAALGPMGTMTAHVGHPLHTLPCHHHGTRTRLGQGTRCMAQATAKKVRIKPPSSSTAATELEALSQWSTIIPDTVLMQKIEELELQAATVSSTVLAGMMGNPRVAREYQMAIEHGIQYDKCQTDSHKLACILDKALANVGAIFAEQVEGRVSTEVDPRAAYDTDKMLSRAHNLIENYKENGISSDRILIRLPATWQGIQAAKQLEQEGVAAHVTLIYSFVQAQAAAQAGVSVIQPNVGRIMDWYKKHPGYIKNQRGPRSDGGSLFDNDNPGVQLAERIYNYCAKYHPKTKVMVAGFRSKADALALAGVDYLVLNERIVDSLDKASTLQGYNDGFRADEKDDESGVPQQLSSDSAQQVEFSSSETVEVTRQLFEEGLGMAGLELLDTGIKSLVEDVNRLEPIFSNLAIDSL
ncbi:TPA: hypothetical protein ACH3X2_001449 [Trebouxia sp. C0005]|nr:MAG: transaldolase 2 [Trebouxia sp. A1-2]